MSGAPQQSVPTSPVMAQPVFQTDSTGIPISASNPLAVNANVTPAANQRVNAQSNDFVTGSITDLATLLTLSGTPTDANTVNSLMGRLTKIRDLLNATLGIQQSDLLATGTISAAQPAIGTPVSNATVVLAVGQGQSTWKALLLAGGGGFTSGTTIVADKSLDGGTTWITSSFKVAGSVTNTTVQSIVGPGPLELTGTVAAVTHIRIRCSVLNSTETIAVTLRAGAGIADVGLISSIPTGTNVIGALTSNQSVNVTQFAGVGTQLMTADGVGGGNFPELGIGIFNGSTVDRVKGQNGAVNVNITSQQGGVAAYASNAAATTAVTDYQFKWGALGTTQVNHIMIQNNTAANVQFNLDATATAGSAVIASGQTFFLDVQTLILHLYTAGVQNVNGTSASNIVVMGWL